jgi:integrase
MKPKAKTDPKWPLLIKRGNVTVKVYRGQNRIGNTVYPQFTLAYYSGNQRVRRKFSDLVEVQREAEIAATKLAAGDHEVLKLTAADRALYLQSLEVLRPLNIPLNVAVLEFVAARKGLPEGATLNEAVDFFRRRSPAYFEKRTVQQVVDEIVATKTAAGLSEVHIKDLTLRLGRFAADFSMPIGSVTSTMLQTWLNAMKRSPRTKLNVMRHVTGLFRYAIGKKYLPKDAIEEVQAVQIPRESPGDISILSPTEMRELLSVASLVKPEMVPWLAVAAFSGLRTAELVRLRWEEIDLVSRHITVPAAKAKTRSRRLAPITDNLLAWLEPIRQPSGPVIPYVSWWNEPGRLVVAVNKIRREQEAEDAKQQGRDPRPVPKFHWKQNSLRHSFISYRVAMIKDVAAVALECGNSPGVIFSNYRELVTEAQAKAWFGVMPPRESNLILMPKAAEVA